MFAAFNTALSALDANGVAVAVVGNNLANMNTTGYKESVAYFQNLVSESMNGGQTQVGFGVASPLTVMQFTQGAISASSGPLDAAIQGNGFFVVNNNGATEFTRAGSFQVDLSGNLLTPSGQQVQGWMATNGVVDTGGAIGNITVPVGALQAPQVTTTMTVSANFNASATTGATSDWSAPVTVYDSLGTAHVVTVNFQQTAANTWSYTATVPGADVTAGTAGTPYDIPNGSGSLTFNSSGQLTSPAAGTPIAFAIPGLSDGAADMSVSWNPYNADGTGTLTQFDQSSATSAVGQNGAAAAQLTSVTMGDGGQLLASYSDGQQTVVAQVAMANIQNPQSLVSTGNNNYQVSADTAAPAVGAPGTGGRGTIVGGALESSNVDMATELTDLIVLQSAYQANSKVVTTVDTMVQAATQLISG
ncbi:MAG TPA: flagellar hook protein FlgE [Bryobacteraceae bacterium]|nr:flagellar hook protein FlgE [Bryobacteraceae bacterium]